MQNKNHLKLIFTVFLPLASGFFLTSIFRTINAVQAPALTHSLSLSTIGLGILSAAYFLSYGLFQIPLGILLDRFGARKIQTVLLCLAGFAIILFAAATNITELVISRLLVGIGVAAGLTAGFKANAAWFPKPKLAVVNSLMMALGGLGALTATAPAQFLITHIGWRQMNLWFAAIIFLLAAIIFFVVPELPQAQNNTKPANNSLHELFAVLKTRSFWSIAPLLATTSGFFVALQGLWAGNWLRDAAGLTQHKTAIYLLIVAIAMVIGMLIVAWLAHNASHKNWSLHKITTIGFLLTFILEIILFSNIWPHDLLLWALFSLCAQLLTLIFTIGSQAFPLSHTGRATTGLVLLLFITAFIMQSGIGFILHLWQLLPNGAYPIKAYQLSFGICIGLQFLAFLWWIKQQRSKMLQAG